MVTFNGSFACLLVQDVINFFRSSLVNFCEQLLSLVYVAHSSRGLGHLPLKEEITGSNPVCATISPLLLIFVSILTIYILT
jgi:hypothetical protein